MSEGAALAASVSGSTIDAATLHVVDDKLFLGGPLGERIRVVLERGARAHARRPRLDSKAQAVFLYGLSQGLAVDEASMLAGVHDQSAYELRKRDPEFARRWADAYEAGVAPLERTAQGIAVGAIEATMPQVRGLELAMRLRLGSLRHPGQRSPQASAELKDGDGRSFKVVIGSPGVD